ncbi:MAG: N-acetylmuramoyl-L-alanine amidase [Solirubrobacterales bacterium]|nr:N-acetylmuramoyl-L-alanine amidase [Solirubrobacterales bacterium]
MKRRAAVVLSVLVAGAMLAGFGGADSPGQVNRGSTATVAKAKVRPVPAWIDQRFIPFSDRRKRQMARYSLRHYGVRSWRLKNPRQIVEHVAVASSAAAVRRVFARNRPDPEFGELPNVCAHFVVSGSGRVIQLVPLGIRCRHVVGLNHVAIGIEHTGFRDGDVLGNRRQMRASIRLTRWLRCRYDIGIRDVIGHAESLGSRFHRELVPSMKNQTHGDFRHSSMKRYRQALHGAGRCPR